MTAFYAPVSVPDGTYIGTQSGYEVCIVVGGVEWVRFTHSVGVRGLDVPVVVKVSDGEATVQWKQ